MAREIITKCDVCGQAGPDVRTYTVRVDGQSWDVDLDDEHAKPLLTIAERGRSTESGRRPAGDLRSLEGRIRNRPDET